MCRPWHSGAHLIETATKRFLLKRIHRSVRACYRVGAVCVFFRFSPFNKEVWSFQQNTPLQNAIAL